MTDSFLSGSHIARFLTFLARGVSTKWIETYLRFANGAKLLGVHPEVVGCRRSDGSLAGVA